MGPRNAFIDKNGQTFTLPDNSTTPIILDERPTTVVQEFGGELGDMGRVAVGYAKTTVTFTNQTILTSHNTSWTVQDIKDVRSGNTLVCQALLLSITGGVS